MTPDSPLHTSRTSSRTKVRPLRASAMLGAALLVVAMLLSGCGSLPDPQDAKGRDQTTIIYDRSGEVIATLHGGQNRTDQKLDRVPADLRHAVVATEDKRFYEHGGVDPIGIMRALFADASSGGASQGGSTITQQYVKNAYFSQEKTLGRKIQEALTAQKIERTYSKDQILELYLNTIYFGHGAYGVEAASQAYFGKSVDRLTLPESALIAGVIKSPGTYSPYLNKTAAKTRRDLVLKLMLDQGYISQADYAKAVKTQVRTAGLKQADTKAPYFVEYVKEQLVDEFGAPTVYRGGLRVTTTLDLPMQEAAEKAIASTLDRASDPSAALVAIKPKTGEIRAMVGGRDFDTQQFNVATQGRRQPGSAFKPFVLAAALKDGVSPEQSFDAEATTIELPDGPWRVTGSQDASSLRLREALVKSVNAVFAHLIVQIGADKVASMAHDLGITTDITAVPAIALGGLKEGVSPLEMANAYATLAANGKRAEPRAYTKVTDANGTVLKETQATVEQAVDPAVAYLSTDVMKGVITDGTGAAADIGRPAAGKTGTTQEYRDAWFVGYTPDLAASVWVGYPDAQREMLDVHGRKVTGGSFPAVIWAQFMRAALARTPEHEFTRPAGIVEEQVCAETGLIANDYCPETFTGVFAETSVPGVCTLHKAPPKVKVPGVVGLTADEATSKLAAAGFKVTTADVESSATAGTVVSQSPGGGVSIVKGSTVKLRISKGAPAPPDTVPVKPVISGPGAARVGQAVDFDGIESAGDIASYSWDFGDGVAASGMTVTHVYKASGTFTVTLTVTGRAGDTASANATIVVKPK